MDNPCKACFGAACADWPKIGQAGRRPVGKGKAVDVVYLLYPTADFVKEMKAANQR